MLRPAPLLGWTMGFGSYMFIYLLWKEKKKVEKIVNREKMWSREREIGKELVFLDVVGEFKVESSSMSSLIGVCCSLFPLSTVHAWWDLNLLGLSYCIEDHHLRVNIVDWYSLGYFRENLVYQFNLLVEVFLVAYKLVVFSFYIEGCFT